MSGNDPLATDITKVRIITGGATGEEGSVGTTGQLLMKFGNAPEDYEWTTPVSLSNEVRYDPGSGDTVNTDSPRYYHPVDIRDIFVEVLEDILVSNT